MTRLLLLAALSLLGACDQPVPATSCRVQCDEAENICLQKCNDDSCRTQCSTELTNCTASCDTVKFNPDAGQ